MITESWLFGLAREIHRHKHRIVLRGPPSAYFAGMQRQKLQHAGENDRDFPTASHSQQGGTSRAISLSPIRALAFLSPRVRQIGYRV